MMSTIEQPVSPHADTMVRGSVWMVAMRWCMRGIGLISTVILARLLTPEDFGIVAMCMIVVGLLEAISYTGVDLALIRDSRTTRHHYDTAWTIQVLQASIHGGILYVF